MKVHLIAAGKYHDIDFARLELLNLLAEHPEARTTVAVEVRQKRTYVKRDQVDGAPVTDERADALRKLEESKVRHEAELAALSEGDRKRREEELAKKANEEAAAAAKAAREAESAATVATKYIIQCRSRAECEQNSAWNNGPPPRPVGEIDPPKCQADACKENQAVEV